MRTWLATSLFCAGCVVGGPTLPSDPCMGITCLDVLPAAIDGTTLGATLHGFDTYACDDGARLDGAEAVHRVTVVEEGLLVAAVDGASVAILAALDPSACLDLHGEAVAAWVEPGEVWVIVDSAAGSEGDFSLRMSLMTTGTFEAAGIAPALAADALTVLTNGWAWGATRRVEYVVVDFTRHSAEPRQWVFDLSTGELLWSLRVAHGRLSTDGVDLAHAATFSNEPGSNQSSLGLLRSAGPYVGTYGPSFRLEGLEPGLNDEVCARDIVMHPWSPMGDEYVGRCGWARPSLGCPAIDSTLSMPVRDRLTRPDGTTLDHGVLMFFWHSDAAWRTSSPYLSATSASTAVLAQQAVECDSSTDGTPTPPASGEYACD